MFINASPFEIPRRCFSWRVLISSSLRASDVLGLTPLLSFLSCALRVARCALRVSCAFKSNVFDDTDGIFAFFQMSIKTWKHTPKA